MRKNQFTSGTGYKRIEMLRLKMIFSYLVGKDQMPVLSINDMSFCT